MHWKGCGEPTQALYHIPAPVLKKTDNVVVIFEETSPGEAAPRHLDSIELVRLTSHQ